MSVRHHRWRAAIAATLAVAVAACTSDPGAAPSNSAPLTTAANPTSTAPVAPGTTPATDPAVPGSTTSNGNVVAYANGFGDGWENYGWSATVPSSGPAELDLGDYGGWILARPGLTGTFRRVEFDIDVPPGLGDDFLQIRLSTDDGPTLEDTPVPLQESGNGGVQRAGLDLDANAQTFDRIVFSATRPLPAGTKVRIDQVVLIAGRPEELATAPTNPPIAAAATVQCAAPRQPISPEIYGIAFRSIDDRAAEEQWTMGATGRRWGGNPTSRYNWESGHFWNTAQDYYFRNVAIMKGPVAAHDQFMIDNWAHGMSGAITVPMLGWVSKDDSSYSFPVTDFGAQESTDPDIPDAGNGKSPDGKMLTPLDPSRTSIRSTPESIERWVKHMVDSAAAAGKPAPYMYFLDNETELWADTHRDVRTELLGYDELLKLTIDYASAIRRADPKALIAGPTSWGWLGYLYSARDAENGYQNGPDRAAHNGQPLIEWYLDQLREHEERTGQRLLDVLDLHFYPMQQGVYAGGEGRTDSATAALRLRSTRSLWDPTYRDESWIDDTIELLPRMKRWADKHYPGLKLSIGEYSFGAERHMSGALAQAEALGRFGQFGLYSAYYWTRPPNRSPLYWAFRAFRDFDGQGGRFLDFSVPVEAPAGGQLSLFASADAASGDGKMVLIALNNSPDTPLTTTIGLDGCGQRPVTAYSYTGAPTGLQPATATPSATGISVTLAPYSITVLSVG